MKKILFLLLVVGLMSACGGISEEERRADDEMAILDYFEENGITDAIPADDDSGVYYRILEAGDGINFPERTSVIRAWYKGWLLTESPLNAFDKRVEGQDDYLEIFLGNLVYGWQVALPNISKGAKAQIFIPSHAGYGNQERQNIPKYSVLIFEVELINFF